MRKKKSIDKSKRENILKIIGSRINKYSFTMIIVLSIILLLLTGAMVTWGLSPDVVSIEHEIAYYVTNGFMMMATLANIVILIINKKHPIPVKIIAIIYHLYAF